MLPNIPPSPLLEVVVYQKRAASETRTDRWRAGRTQELGCIRALGCLEDFSLCQEGGESARPGILGNILNADCILSCVPKSPDWFLAPVSKRLGTNSLFILADDKAFSWSLGGCFCDCENLHGKQAGSSFSPNCRLENHQNVQEQGKMVNCHLPASSSNRRPSGLKDAMRSVRHNHYEQFPCFGTGRLLFLDGDTLIGAASLIQQQGHTACNMV